MKTKSKKLPANLPKLPDGYHYIGMGNGGKWAAFEGAALTSSGQGKWRVDRGFTGVHRDTHYAVKRPAKKTKKPERKSARVVAKVIFAHMFEGEVERVSKTQYTMGCNVPILVLPADAASVERMILQAAKAACAADGLDWSKQADPMTSGSGADDQSAYIATARAALAAIGVRLLKKRKV